MNDAAERMRVSASDPYAVSVVRPAHDVGFGCGRVGAAPAVRMCCSLSGGGTAEVGREGDERLKGVGRVVGGVTGCTCSGEEKQVDFTGAGTVLVQWSELGRAGGSTLEHITAQLSSLGSADLLRLGQSVQEQMKQQRS